MTENPNIYARDYSITELVIGNMVIILWIVLGALSCALLHPLTAVAFFALATFLVFFELGKHGCVTCYYCKTCTIGFGKLPHLFFRKTTNANVNKRALRLFPFVYLLLSVLPIILVVASLIQEVTFFKFSLLTAVLTFSVYTGIIRRKTISMR